MDLLNSDQIAQSSTEAFVPPEEGTDITPEDSVVPIYSIPPDLEGIAAMQADNAAQQQEIESIISSREEAATRLRSLGFPEDQINAIMGPAPTFLI